MSDDRQFLFEAIDYSKHPTWRRIFIFLAFLPFVYIVISALYLLVQWNKIPNRIPQHYGLFSDGVNIWASKGFWGVYFLLIFCLFPVAIMIIIFFFFLKHPFKPAEPSDDSPVDRAREKLKAIIFILAAEHGIALLICHACVAGAVYQHAMLKASSRLIGTISTIVIVPALFFGPLYYWLKARLTSNAEDRTEENNQAQDFSKHWKLGVFYWNPENPSHVVPKRFGTGYTFNFAARLAWVYVGFFLFPIILVFTIIYLLSCL